MGKNPIFTLKYLKIAPKFFSGELFGGAKFENLIMKGGGVIPAPGTLGGNLGFSPNHHPSSQNIARRASRAD